MVIRNIAKASSGEKCASPDDGPHGEGVLANYLKNKLSKKSSKDRYILLKHHHFFNMTSYG